MLQAVATGQTKISGAAVMPEVIQSVPFVVRIKLTDTEFAARLPAGSTGTAAIFTDHFNVAHVIRKVLLRQVAITNYVNPFYTAFSCFLPEPRVSQCALRELGVQGLSDRFNSTAFRPRSKGLSSSSWHALCRSVLV